jgi:hypothetical protein
MGTSTARRAPTTRVWRLAKGAAHRYLSPEGSSSVTAREVAARYVAALEEGSGPEGGGALAAFRLARKMAQNLGEFCRQANGRDWQGALEQWGLAGMSGQSPEAAAHGLAAVWLAGAGGLEEAALRPALVGLLTKMLRACTGSPEPKPALETAAVVTRFLAAAFYQRLVFDLGESLEAAAGDWRALTDGLAGLHDEIAAVAAAAGEAPAPADWRGLEGWLWVTRVMARMLGYFPRKTSPG